MRLTRIVFTLAAAMTLLPLSAARAQEASPPPHGPAHAPAPGEKPNPLANWWAKSSYEYDPVPDKLLIHAGSQFSFTDSRGNTSGTNLQKSGELVLRKHRTTNRLSLEFINTDMIYGLGGGAVDYQAHTLRNHVEHDLSKKLLVVGGLEYARNTLMFIDRRLTAYGGFGTTVEQTEHQKLSIIGGLGYVWYKFQEEEMLQVDPVAVAALPTTTPTSGGALLTQAWRWSPHKSFTLTQSASILEYFHQDLGELITFSISVSMPVNKYISMVPHYDVKEEDNIYVRALDVKTNDRTFGIGFRLEF